MGEHAVVYGKPALLTAIDKRLYVRIKNYVPPQRDPASGGKLGITSRLSGISPQNAGNKENVVIKSSENDSLIRKTIEVFKSINKLTKLPPMEISVTSQIPVGSGLGSSAALAVALSGALLKFIYNIWNPSKINELAYQFEKIQHGSPSGADNSIATMGGIIWYRKEFEFLKSIWSLPIRSYKFPGLILINSGKPRESTADMVKNVALRYKIKKKYLDNLFNDQESLSKKLLLALKSDDRKEFCIAIKKGEANLEKMEVVSKTAQLVIREIEKVGGVAKISGAGGEKYGSGMLLCYHENLMKLEKIAKKRKLDFFPINLGEEGVRLEREKLSNQQIIQSTNQQIIK